MEWRLGEFTEDRELGRGAQGRVVLARHTASGTPVAIKYLGCEDPAAVAALRSEGQMLGRLNSPYVARLYRFAESEHGAAIVMEAINGVSLKEVLREHGSLTPEAALLVLKGSLLGLAAAHAVGVVHRDYKPANVVVRADGLSKLVDFGVAVLAGQGSASGTPLYMAPEQWRGEPATPATDVYAATCVFVECVTGRRPFAGDRAALMNQHLTAPVDVADVPEPLRPLVESGTAKDPAERPPGAAAFVTWLESAASAAYGSDWESRGVRALAGAAVALAALFPLGALAAPASAGAGAAGAAGAAGTAAAGASGAAGTAGGGAAGTVAAGASGASGAAGTGGGAAVGAAVSKGFLATAAGKWAAGAVGAAVVAASAGGAVHVARDDTESPPPPASVVVTLAADNRTLTGGPVPVLIEGARYPKVTGLADKELERRVNAELRGPLDRLIEMGRDAARRLPCQGRPVRIGTETTLGLRGPRLLSVRYFQLADLCQQADGTPGGEVVTVDLRTGRRLTARDVFRPSTLTPQGLRRLQSTVEQIRDGMGNDWENCSPDGRFKVADFFPGQSGGVFRDTDPPYLSAFFTPGEFQLAYLVAGSIGCEHLRFRASYAAVRDLLKPEIVRLLPGAPSPART